MYVPSQPKSLGDVAAPRELPAFAADGSLAECLRQHPQGLPWRQAVAVVTALADLLAAAHARGVCHGAISPEAVQLTAGGQVSLDESTPNFGPCTAPEQIRASAPIDARCDVYATGVVLYRLLCNRYPFRSADREELKREIIEDAPQPPRQLAHGLPPQLERLCLGLLAKEPSARPADADEVARELRRLLDETETTESAGLPAARKTLASPRDNELWMIVSWGDEATPGLQAAARDYLLRVRGVVLRQTESETVAQMPPTFDTNVTGMTAFLDHAVTLLSELKPGDRSVGFEIDSAESDTLKHRAPRLTGRVTAGGWEIDAATLDLVRRWLPCRAVPGTLPGNPGQPEESSCCANSVWEACLTAERSLPVRVTACGANAPTPPLVGRTAQLAMLKARWDQAREGMGQIVLLIGDEGSGKTRLIQELGRVVAAANQDAQWIRWWCRPGSSSESLHPAGEFFRNAGGQLPAALTDEALRGLTATQRRNRWQQELWEWRKQRADASPVVFVVEDLQWVDPATLAFLHQLVDLGISERVLTILTFRPEFETPWGSRAHQTQVALSRLTRRHAASLFSSITGFADPPASLVDELLSATDGIPLFVEGFARARRATIQ